MKLRRRLIVTTIFSLVLPIFTLVGVAPSYATDPSISTGANVVGVNGQWNSLSGKFTLNNFDPIENIKATISTSSGLLRLNNLSTGCTIPTGFGYPNTTTQSSTLVACEGTPSQLQAFTDGIDWKSDLTVTGAKVTMQIGPSGLVGGFDNKHIYEFVFVAPGSTWAQANTAANAKTYIDENSVSYAGYLATISSQAENDFIFSLVKRDAWFGASANPTVVKYARSRAGLDDVTVTPNSFYHVSGPEQGTQLTFYGWAANEPNNPGTEDYAEFYNADGKWNNLDGLSALGYIVEYGGAGFGGPVESALFKSASIDASSSNKQNHTFSGIGSDSVSYGTNSNKYTVPTVINAGNGDGTLIYSTSSANCSVNSTGEISYSGVGSCAVSVGTENSSAFTDSASTTFTLTVTQAVTTTTVTCSPSSSQYTSSPQTPCSATVTGDGGLNETGLVPTSYSNNTDAGLASVTYNYPGATNYKDSSDTEEFTISQRTGTVSYTGTFVVPLGSKINLTASSDFPAYCPNNKYRYEFSPISSEDWTIFTSEGLLNQTPTTTSLGLSAGAYRVRIVYNHLGTGNCAYSKSDESDIITVYDLASNAHGAGFYTNPGFGKANFGFVVQLVPKTTNVYKGQVVWNYKNTWRFKGTLNYFGKSSLAASASGTGTLQYWDPNLVSTGVGGWAIASTNVNAIINFTATTPASRKSGALPGSFVINFNYTTPSGWAFAPLPTVNSLSALKNGNITYR